MFGTGLAFLGKFYELFQELYNEAAVAVAEKTKLF